MITITVFIKLRHINQHSVYATALVSRITGNGERYGKNYY